METILFHFSSTSYLYLFLQISAFPGALIYNIPAFPGDPSNLSIATALFPNPSMLDRAEAEDEVFSLRSSLSVTKTLLEIDFLVLCKVGPRPHVMEIMP